MKDTEGHFRVYWMGQYPKPKRHFHPGSFETRREARNFCRNKKRQFYVGLTIVHPDGEKEEYL